MLRVGPPEVIVQAPRRVRGGARSLKPVQQAVVVTTALLNTLLGLSLPRAAEAVDIYCCPVFWVVVFGLNFHFKDISIDSFICPAITICSIK